MEAPNHTLTSLFAQLGLANSARAIEAFIATHKPLPGDITLYQADFWNASQAEFLRQEIAEDADWVVIIDQLDAMLR